MNLKRYAARSRRRLIDAVSSNVVAAKWGRRDGDLVRVGSLERPKLARTDAGLRLPELAVNSSLQIRGLFDDAGVGYWVIGDPNLGSTVLGVDSRDFASVKKALVGSDALQHWYVRPLAASGGVAAGVWTVADNKVKSSWLGFELFEAVVHPLHSSFGSTARQGVRVHFWDLDSETGRMVSRVRSARVGELPDRKTAREDFNRSLDAANQSLADEPNFPIDAVYTWVDGTDEDWQRLKAAAQVLQSGESLIQDALATARFADHDELRYSLRSIEQYAPWIRKIWIVTNGQVPAWLDLEHPKVQIVTHEEIWPTAEGLPNFNSHAIEACLHRIEGLAEHYLYFNDDMILGRPVNPSRFFHGNGISKFFYSRALVDFCDIGDEDNASTIAAKNSRMAMGSMGSKTASRKFFHTPSPLRRSVAERLEEAYPEQFAVTRRAQFRENTDIAIAGSFYFNVAGAMGEAVPARIGYDYIDPAIEDGRRRMLRVIAKHDKDTICVNDGSTDETDEQRIETDVFIRKSLEEFLPVASRFEKSS